MTTQTTTQTPGYRWPTGVPSWQEQELSELSSEGALGTIPPQILAGIDYYTSDFGDEGVAINSSGYGGYFGEHANEAYPGGTVSTATLETASSAAFATEAEISASALGSYGHTPVGDLNEYATGTPSKSSGFTAWMQEHVLPEGVSLSSFNPLSGLTWLWTWAHGTAVPKTQNISLLPGAAVGTSLAGSWEKAAAELLLVAAGGVLVIFGLYKAAGSPGQGAAEKAAPLAAAAGA